VTIFVERRADQLAIPNQAIFQEAGEVWVWVREDGGFVERPVAIGERSISRTIVLEGLDEGDVVALADPSEVENEEAS
jgi:multidrug efflux pump subunit AcrA (membrane-fusion protein)